MGHLSISNMNKNENQITFIVLKFSNLSIFEQEYVLIFFWMVKIIKIPSGFELMTYRSVFKVFYFISRKKKFIKIIKMGGKKRVIYKKKWVNA